MNEVIQAIFSISIKNVITSNDVQMSGTNQHNLITKKVYKVTKLSIQFLEI